MRVTNFADRIRFPFSRWLPIAAILLSFAIVLMPATRLYVQWRAALGSGDRLMLTKGNFQMIVERRQVLRTAIQMTALGKRETIWILNAPGRFLASLVSQTVTHHATSFPDFVNPYIWDLLSFPLFAIPAWYFAGRGIDGLLLRRRMRRSDFILSAVLVLLSILISAGLRFGLTASERDDEFTIAFIDGFALWSVLFAFPLAGWLRQRAKQRASASEPVTD